MELLRPGSALISVTLIFQQHITTRLDCVWPLSSFNASGRATTKAPHLLWLALPERWLLPSSTLESSFLKKFWQRCAARVFTTIPLATEFESQNHTLAYRKLVKIIPLTLQNVTKVTTFEAKYVSNRSKILFGLKIKRVQLGQNELDLLKVYPCRGCREIWEALLLRTSNMASALVRNQMCTCPRLIKLICATITCSSIGRVSSGSHLSDKAKITFWTIGRPFWRPLPWLWNLRELAKLEPQNRPLAMEFGLKKWPLAHTTYVPPPPPPPPKGFCRREPAELLHHCTFLCVDIIVQCPLYLQIKIKPPSIFTVQG